jgi:hypothetical protein
MPSLSTESLLPVFLIFLEFSLFSAIGHSKMERFVLPPKNLPKVLDFLISGESEFIETTFRLLVLVNDAKLVWA